MIHQTSPIAAGITFSYGNRTRLGSSTYIYMCVYLYLTLRLHRYNFLIKPFIAYSYLSLSPSLLQTSTDTAENSSPASGDQEPAGCDLSPDFHLSAPWSPIRRKGVLKSHSFGNRPRTFSEYSAGPSCCHLGSGVGGDGCVAGSCEHTRARSASVLERPVGGGDDFCRVLGGGGDASCADSDPFAEFRHAAAPLIEDDDWTPSTSRESFPREKRNNVAAVGSRDSRGSSRAGDMVGANMKGGGADGGGTRRRRNTGGDSMVRLLERERLYPHGRDVLPVSWLA